MQQKKNPIVRNSSLVSFPVSKYWNWWFPPLCWEEEPSSKDPLMSLGENVGNVGLLVFISHVGENSALPILSAVSGEVSEQGAPCGSLTLSEGPLRLLPRARRAALHCAVTFHSAPHTTTTTLRYFIEIPIEPVLTLKPPARDA